MLAMGRQLSHVRLQQRADTGPVGVVDAHEAYEIIASAATASDAVPTPDRYPQIPFTARDSQAHTPPGRIKYRCNRLSYFCGFSFVRIGGGGGVGRGRGYLRVDSDMTMPKSVSLLSSSVCLLSSSLLAITFFPFGIPV